jgi:UDP-glucose 4,6-dehydratase
MITLIGHGYVGKYIAKELNSQNINFRWITHSQVNEIGLPWGTQFIINAAGFTGVPNVDACEISKDETIEGNVHFPLVLEQKASALFSPVLHISSGCVYTGYTDGGWKEEDVPNFTFNNASFYSASKTLFQSLWEEQYSYKSYLFRIRMPFGPDNNPKNLLSKLKSYDKLIDNVNSLSNVEEVAKAVVYFVLNRPPFGLYNAVNPTGISTKEIANMLELDKQWMTPEEFKSISKAPRSNCVLNTDKMQSVFQFNDVYQSLSKNIEKMDK